MEFPNFAPYFYAYKMTRILRYFLLGAVLVCSPMFVPELIAQGGPPVGGQPPCWPPPCIPIDGGLGLLIAAGALIGGKKAFELSREKK